MSNTLWQKSSDELLSEWRQFRLDVDDLEDEELLVAVLDWWHLMPLGSREIDPYDSKDWPDPWRLLYDKKYDENVRALGIAYTLHLLDWPCDVLLIQEITKGFLGLVILVDSQHILNYTYNVIEDVDNMPPYELLKKWDTVELTKR